MKNILLLEDLPEIRAWLKSLVLQVFPTARITECSRVQDALLQVQSLRFDLALCDLGLPDGSGIEVVRALHQQQPQALSVVVTIYDDDDHIFPALQAGAFGYLLKEQAQATLVAQLLRISQGEPPLSPSIARQCSCWAAFPWVSQAAKTCWPGHVWHKRIRWHTTAGRWPFSGSRASSADPMPRGARYRSTKPANRGSICASSAAKYSSLCSAEK